MEDLTPAEFNNEIVKLRKIVSEAKIRVTRKLIAQIQRYKQSKDEKKKKRIIKYEQEIAAIKHETPVDQIALYKVATENALVIAIDELRKRYPNWHQQFPFYLQRASSKKIKKNDEKKPLESEKRGQTLIKRINLNDAEDLINKDNDEEKNLKKMKSLISSKPEDEEEESDSAEENNESEASSIDTKPIKKNKNTFTTSKLKHSNPKMVQKKRKFEEKSPKKNFKKEREDQTNQAAKKDDSKLGKLHPSWVAKQKHAEEQKKLLNTVKNKKIKFSD